MFRFQLLHGNSCVLKELRWFSLQSRNVGLRFSRCIANDSKENVRESTSDTNIASLKQLVKKQVSQK